ncbi:fibrillin-1-like isoform X2 [Centruroides vittatus]|uniref:fibrillin-1-like isoform X2 n=1 Tax=Centruroides vittatus TaxID=120091 RepID=UPI00350FFE60
MISIKILFLFAILNVLKVISGVTNICNVGEPGYIACKEKDAICIISNTRIFNYSCECRTGYEFNENSTKCIEDQCSEDSSGYRFCRAEKANCHNDPTSEKGYVCVCDEGKQRNPISEMCEEIANYTHFVTEKQAISSTEEVPIVENIPTTKATVEDPCSSCTKNTTCIVIEGSYFCECNIGYVPKPDYQILVKKCSAICSTAECQKNCDNIKKKKQCYKILNEEIGKTEGINGWMIGTIILCILVVIFFIVIIYLIRRNYILQNSLKDNCSQQLIYKKMETEHVPSEDMTQYVSFIGMESGNI